jgi:hypothetical protein
MNDADARSRGGCAPGGATNGFPDPPGLEQIIARLRNGEPFKDGLEALEVLAAIMFSCEEEADEFEAWVRRERRKHLA